MPVTPVVLSTYVVMVVGTGRVEGILENPWGSSDCSVWNVCCGRGATAVEEAAAVEKDAVEVAAAEESAAVEEDAIVEEAAAVEVARTHFGRHAIKSHGYLGGRKLSTAPPTDPEGTVGGTTAVKLYSILSGSLCDS